MPDDVRVIIQVRSTPALAAASFGTTAATPALDVGEMAGVELDASFSPVPIPPRPSAEEAREAGFTMATRFTEAEPSTHVVRAAVSEDGLTQLLERAEEDPNVVGVFSDPRIEPIAVCPNGPVGTDLDVEQLLMVDEL